MADRSELYESILAANLQRAIDFVRFGEAKNAALIALASGWVLAAISLQCSGHPLTRTLSICVPLSLLFSLCAAITALCSFIPRLHLPSFLGGKRAGPHPPNLLYFGDIASMTAKTLQSEIHSRYFPKNDAPRDEYIHDLAVQISVNSCIAKRKMLLFRAGMMLFLLASGSLLAPAFAMTITAMSKLW